MTSELIPLGGNKRCLLSVALETHSTLCGKMQSSFEVTAGVMLKHLCSEMLQGYRKLQNVEHLGMATKMDNL
jgi:hypothetical protein